jgi:endonuclease G
MWKLLTGLSVWMVILSTHVVHANDGRCAHVAPHGLPQIELSDSQVICRPGYVLQHDNQARIPVWVSYTLSRAQTLACAPRPDRFEPEPMLRPRQRADLSDYRRSGYDQGHMAPNADLSWDPQVQRESFYLSNIAPQLPALNRGLWRELEAIVRAWAYTRGSLTIYVGPIYSRTSTSTIGTNRVVVPDAFFKIVIDNGTREHVAFIFPHTSTLPDHVRDVQTTVSHIQAISHIQFPIPSNITTQLPLWNINTRLYVTARSQSCAVNR